MLLPELSTLWCHWSNDASILCQDDMLLSDSDSAQKGWMDCHRGMLPILLLLAFACQACEIEFSRSSSPLVGIDDIADMDGEFYVKWAHLVKNPSCVSRVEVKVDNRTKVDKSCDCANAPPESTALKSYLDKILVSQPPGTSLCLHRVIYWFGVIDSRYMVIMVIVIRCHC